MINSFFQKLKTKLFLILNWVMIWVKQVSGLSNGRCLLLALVSKPWRYVFLISAITKNFPSLVFNDTKVQISNAQKHLGLILDSKLDFNEHIDNKINKCNNIKGIMKRVSLILLRKCLLTIYKSFVRPNLDYADIIYDRPFNESFKGKIEMVQYKAVLVITGAIKGTSRHRLYQELGLESLAEWSRRLFFLSQSCTGTLPILSSNLLQCC